METVLTVRTEIEADIRDQDRLSATEVRDIMAIFRGGAAPLAASSDRGTIAIITATA